MIRRRSRPELPKFCCRIRTYVRNGFRCTCVCPPEQLSDKKDRWNSGACSQRLAITSLACRASFARNVRSSTPTYNPRRKLRWHRGGHAAIISVSLRPLLYLRGMNHDLESHDSRRRRRCDRHRHRFLCRHDRQLFELQQRLPDPSDVRIEGFPRYQRERHRRKRRQLLLRQQSIQNDRGTEAQPGGFPNTRRVCRCLGVCHAPPTRHLLHR